MRHELHELARISNGVLRLAEARSGARVCDPERLLLDADQSGRDARDPQPQLNRYR